MLGGLTVHEVVPPDVPLGDRDVLTGPAYDEDVLDAGALGDRLVDRRLERAGRAAAEAAVGVTTTFASASWMRLLRAEEEKPPKTTEWIAPILAQASRVIGSSGIIGM